jgi:hypothetical protein
MRRTCNTDASRATGWAASMSSPYVGLPSGLCSGTRPRARACRLVLDSELGAAAVWCTLLVHLVDQRAIVWLGPNFRESFSKSGWLFSDRNSHRNLGGSSSKVG